MKRYGETPLLYRNEVVGYRLYEYRIYRLYEYKIYTTIITYIHNA